MTESTEAKTASTTPPTSPGPLPVQQPTPVLVSLFRIIAILEGVSFLILLGIAMPLKYVANMPLPVRIVGMAHGVLFILFCILLIPVVRKLSLGVKAGIWGFVSSLLPFGTFVFDAHIKRRIVEMAAS